ncbi:hypothetical protein H6G33_23805 [Calothrix sp. FACHB-1219]|nr:MULTISPECIES: hypothetical protein [unclassified Calothrix]MBD2205261.1 hypothetical protein [Calothrix sp. FACHB-168]MBD2220035.1 hypothetical protein [Calothrix sp. FACHB-1219]
MPHAHFHRQYIHVEKYQGAIVKNCLIYYFLNNADSVALINIKIICKKTV